MPPKCSMMLLSSKSLLHSVWNSQKSESIRFYISFGTELVVVTLKVNSVESCTEEPEDSFSDSLQAKTNFAYFYPKCFPKCLITKLYFALEIKITFFIYVVHSHTVNHPVKQATG